MKHVSILLLPFLFACSSGPEVQRQKYAEQPSEMTFEHEFPVVWKAVEEALRGKKILKKDPDYVSKVEMKSIEERTLETDWMYGKSRDKYVTYKVNKSPRKKYLQVRFRYLLKAQRVMGGTKVIVDLDEEIEKLNSDGSSAGYVDVEQVDTSRSNQLLEEIRNKILSAP